MDPARRRPDWTHAALGIAALLLSVAPLERDRVSRREAAAFRFLNDLPDALHPPVWLVMQLGTVGAAPLAGGIALLAGRRRLALRLTVAGTLTWALSKGIKRLVRRGRPAGLLAEVHIRGWEQAGLGYLSGHAGVALALAAGAWPVLDRRGRLTATTLVPLVGISRLYVGAHLPLDVVGGAALGWTVDAAVRQILELRPVPWSHGQDTDGRLMACGD